MRGFYINLTAGYDKSCSFSLRPMYNHQSQSSPNTVGQEPVSGSIGSGAVRLYPVLAVQSTRKFDAIEAPRSTSIG